MQLRHILCLLPILLAGLVQGSPAPGNTLSQTDVGNMYAHAREMLEDRSIQDVSTVPLLLETCTREGHPDAARLLMDVYEGKFKGLEANAKQAAHLARSLAESPRLDRAKPELRKVRTEAMYRLALYLEKGTGCTANKQEAYQWMHKAALRGMSQAKVEEARYLMCGNGVSANPQLAWQILRSQAEAKDAPETPHLFFYMGYMCAQGIGMPRNARLAFELYRHGARLNDARCLNNLGTMFEKGYPTPRNSENALKLYRKAAHLGNREASANMQRLVFKEGIRARNLSITPPKKRIDNAVYRVILALPISEYSRERLKEWLQLSKEDHEI